MEGEDLTKRHRGRKRWTQEEDSILHEEAVKQGGNVRDWHKIATKLPGRTNKDCRKRWVNKVCGGLKKGLWDREEDRRLQAAVEKHGLRWPLIAAAVGFRSPDQCAKRWQYGLDPRLKHREWTQDEDNLLLSLVQKRGREWKAIQQNHYPTRSRIDLKNRYTILMRRMSNNGGDQESTSSPDDASETSSISGTSDDGPGMRSRPSRSPGVEMDPRRSISQTPMTPPMPRISIGSQFHSRDASLDWLTDASTCFSPMSGSDGSVHHSPICHHLTPGHLDIGDGLNADSALAMDFLEATSAPINLSPPLTQEVQVADPWDDPFGDSNYHVQALQGLLTSFTTTVTEQAVGEMEASKADMGMTMGMEFEAELMSPSGPSIVSPHSISMDEGTAGAMLDAAADGPRTCMSRSASASDRQMNGSRGGPDQTTIDLDRVHPDLSKVIIAVEGCDKDTLDYLFSMTRPIKHRVKMEITM